MACKVTVGQLTVCKVIMFKVTVCKVAVFKGTDRKLTFLQVTVCKGMEGAGRRNNEMPRTDHVTSGPMRGQKKLHMMAQTDRQTGHGHADSMTELAQWSRFCEK